ncbi:MAG: hypothetical protein ACI4HM_07585, partial [Ruminococcus sp.]
FKGYGDNKRTIFLNCFVSKKNTYIKKYLQEGNIVAITGMFYPNYSTVFVDTMESSPSLKDQTVIVDCIGNLCKDITVNENRTAGKTVIACNNDSNTKANYFNLKLFSDILERMERARVKKGAFLHIVANLEQHQYEKDNKKLTFNEGIVLAFDYAKYETEGAEATQELEKAEETERVDETMEDTINLSEDDVLLKINEKLPF